MENAFAEGSGSLEVVGKRRREQHEPRLHKYVAILIRGECFWSGGHHSRAQDGDADEQFRAIQSTFEVSWYDDLSYVLLSDNAIFVVVCLVRSS